MDFCASIPVFREIGPYSLLLNFEVNDAKRVLNGIEGEFKEEFDKCTYGYPPGLRSSEFNLHRYFTSVYDIDNIIARYEIVAGAGQTLLRLGVRVLRRH
eukprot:6206343-Pleurochrysis_carterae.AAC.1